MSWSGFDGLAFSGAVTLSGGAVSLNSNGGAISFSSTLAGGSQDLTIASGTAAGTVTFTGAVSGVGDGTGAAITIDSTGLATFSSTVSAASGIVSVPSLKKNCPLPGKNIWYFVEAAYGVEKVPESVRRLAPKHYVFLADSPVIPEDLELLWYVVEQSVSFDYHRYGNLGPRADEPRSPVL
jgi:hypothetical protein